jgi:hypothetical protein
LAFSALTLATFIGCIDFSGEQNLARRVGLFHVLCTSDDRLQRSVDASSAPRTVDEPSLVLAETTPFKLRSSGHSSSI